MQEIHPLTVGGLPRPAFRPGTVPAIRARDRRYDRLACFACALFARGMFPHIAKVASFG
jgi:hypothetical protein